MQSSFLEGSYTLLIHFVYFIFCYTIFKQNPPLYPVDYLVPDHIQEPCTVAYTVSRWEGRCKGLYRIVSLQLLQTQSPVLCLHLWSTSWIVWLGNEEPPECLDPLWRFFHELMDWRQLCKNNSCGSLRNEDGILYPMLCCEKSLIHQHSGCKKKYFTYE